MPRSVYQRVRSSIQYWCQVSSVPGSTKNSISICSNSRVRKMKLPGVISLRKDLPICPMPNGGFLRAAPITLAKFTKIDRKSTRLNSSHANISYAVFCLKKKKKTKDQDI